MRTTNLPLINDADASLLNFFQKVISQKNSQDRKRYAVGLVQVLLR